MFEEKIELLKQDPVVAKVLQQIEDEAVQTVEEQKYLCAIPSPSNQESQRAKAYYDLFTQLPFDAVWQDEVENVFGLMKGTGDGPKIMLAAHMDTVFSMGTDVTPTVDEDGVIHAPGISDDTRGMVEVLAIARAMLAQNLRPTGDIIFCGDVGEETAGDLRGVRHIFANQKDIDMFISIDGAVAEVLHINGVASRKFKITYTGTGGHALRMFGYPNCNLALGRFLNKIGDIQVPEDPFTIFNVGLLQGGTSINAIPTETYATVDTRSLSEDALDVLEEQIHSYAQLALEEENQRWNHPTERVECQVEMLSRRPGGSQSTEDSFVQVAMDAYRAFGMDVRVSKGASTDANIPISLGIPALAVSRGGSGKYAHTVNEQYNPKNGHLGPQRDVIMLLLLSGYGTQCEGILKKK